VLITWVVDVVIRKPACGIDRISSIPHADFSITSPVVTRACRVCDLRRVRRWSWDSDGGLEQSLHPEVIPTGAAQAATTVHDHAGLHERCMVFAATPEQRKQGGSVVPAQCGVIGVPIWSHPRPLRYSDRYSDLLPRSDPDMIKTS
jgi:hypothetical protein